MRVLRSGVEAQVGARRQGQEPPSGILITIIMITSIITIIIVVFISIVMTIAIVIIMFR